MSPHMQELLSQWGYWLMLFGALIEGEVFLIAGGIAAHNGIFHPIGLIALAIVGSMIHDHIFFYIGRFTRFEVLLWSYKKKLSSYRRFKKKINKGLGLFDKYGVILVIGFRFMYGLRTIVPTIVGLSPISKIRFCFLDLIGATLWSCIFVLGGYYFGGAVTSMFKKIHDKLNLSWPILILIAVISVVAIMLIYTFTKKIISRNKSSKNASSKNRITKPSKISKHMNTRHRSSKFK